MLEICKLKLISCFLDHSGHFCMVHLQMTLTQSYRSHSIFIPGILFWFNHIFSQNYVEALLLEPVLWNFVWIDGRLCAFRQSQSEFFNTNTFGVIKVLLVSLAFEHRVNTILEKSLSPAKKIGAIYLKNLSVFEN